MSCGSDGPDGPGPSSGGQAGATGAPGRSLRFLAEGNALLLAPRDFRRVTAAVDPPGAHSVRFFLLPDATGAAEGVADAAIDQSEVISNAEGYASVTLTAPSQPARLRLRASTGGASADLAVVIEQAGLAALSVRPRYSGRRQIDGWTSSVHLQTRCESLESAAGYPDSALLLHTAPDAAILLEDVPAVSPLAVVVRGGGVADGCTTLEIALPRSQTAVDVDVSDRPLGFGDTALGDNVLAFRLSSEAPALKVDLNATAALIGSLFQGTAKHDVLAVLDGMLSELDRNQADLFESARAAALWDEVLPSALGRGSNRRLTQAIARWIDLGASVSTTRTLEGTLASESAEPATPTSLAGVVIEHISGVPAQDAQVEIVDTPRLEVDASDTLAFGATVAWSSASLAAAVASNPALAETGLASPPDALAELLSCGALAHAIAELTEPAVSAWLSECDEACTEQLCMTAVGALWDNAVASSMGAPSRLSVAATASLSLDSLVRVREFSGTWLGRLVADPGAQQLRGQFVGANRERSLP